MSELIPAGRLCARLTVTTLARIKADLVDRLHGERGDHIDTALYHLVEEHLAVHHYDETEDPAAQAAQDVEDLTELAGGGSRVFRCAGCRRLTRAGADARCIWCDEQRSSSSDSDTVLLTIFKDTIGEVLAGSEKDKR